MLSRNKVKKGIEIGVGMTAIAVLLMGCGSSNPGATLSGVVADGYLSGVKVCLDTNSNGVCDTTEPSGISDSNGAYTIAGITPGQETQFPLVAEVPSTAVDKDTGAAVGTAFTLTSPAAASFVSPLTSLVQDKIAAGATAASAVASVEQTLGMTAASGVSVTGNYVSLKGTATDQTNGYFRAHEAAKAVAAVLKQGKSLLGASSVSSTDLSTQNVLLAQAEAVLQMQAASNVGASMFNAAQVNASSVAGAGSLKAAIAAKKASTAAATQAVTINFDVVNGATAVGTTGCTATTLTLGSMATAGKVKDLRFYVSDIALIDAAGNYVPVVLDVNANQDKNVALLDFEDASGSCVGGTAATNTAVTGKVAPGTYVGVALNVGVPGNLNHTSTAATTTPALLQNTAMNWSWQSGRKFTKIEFDKPATADVTGSITGNVLTVTAVASGALAVGDTLAGTGLVVMMGAAPKITALGTGAGGVGTYTLSTTYVTPVAATTIKANQAVTVVHLGSTGCKADPINGILFGCGSPNRMHMSFASFNPTTQKIALDLGSLWGGLDLTTSKTWMAGKIPGAMTNNPDYYYGKFQIDMTTGQPINDGAAQTLFVVK